MPEIVYKKFEEIIGIDIPLCGVTAPNVISVYTWKLGQKPGRGSIRKLVPERKLRFTIKDFSERFISGPHLPKPEILDQAVKQALGIS